MTTTTTTIVDFSKLPNELIHMILNYTGKVIYRYGKYMNRLQSDDYRYSIVSLRKEAQLTTEYLQKVRFTINTLVSTKYMIIEQSFNEIIGKWYLKYKIILKTDDILQVSKVDTYIYDNLGICNKTVTYTM